MPPMANRRFAPPANGTFGNHTREGFQFFGSREAQSATATAATTWRYPSQRVPSPRVESDQAILPGPYAALRQGPEALEAYFAQQMANFRYRPLNRLAFSVRESAEYNRLSHEERILIDRNREINRRMRNERRIRQTHEETFPDFFIDYETDVEYERTLADASKYLCELQPVALDDLPEDSRTCAICKEPYNTDQNPEQACKVGHCGHVLGRTCLSTWVTPAGRRPNKTCPLCRAVLFGADTPDLSSDSDDVDNESWWDAAGHELEGVEAFASDVSAGEDEELYDTDEALSSDISAGENEELDEHEEMVDREYVSEILDSVHRDIISSTQGEEAPGIFDSVDPDVISSTQGEEAWQYVIAQRVERLATGIGPPSHTLSEFVLAYFRIFVRGSNVGASATISAGSSVRHIMGQLYVRLQRDMERTAMPVVWTENGPPLSLLLDPTTIPLIESALERLVDLELQAYAAGRWMNP